MAIFGMRFDFRSPQFAPATVGERYAAALDMVEWADEAGFITLVLSEHHGSDDGYLPSPLTMAAAFAARTRNARIQIAAIVAAFHDPLRLAEDLAVVDQISGGRLDLVVTNGYVPGEFEMFGVDPKERVARTTEVVRTLKAAWTGEPFEYRGRTVRVTPTPFQPGGPRISLGGTSEGAARRAARIGDGFMPSSPEVWPFYRDEVIKLGGADPGPALGADTSVYHLARDPDRTWSEIAPYALHEVNAYGSWMASAGFGAEGGYETAVDADELRSRDQYRVLTPDAFVERMQAGGPFAFAMFHPLFGGMPPDLAWESLRLFEKEALPALRAG